MPSDDVQPAGTGAEAPPSGPTTRPAGVTGLLAGLVGLAATPVTDVASIRARVERRKAARVGAGIQPG